MGKIGAQVNKRNANVKSIALEKTQLSVERLEALKTTFTSATFDLNISPFFEKKCV